SLWGGSIAFDSTRNWYFGTDPAGLRSDQLDFYSAAVHELGHVLGIGTAPQWWSQVQGTQFVGRQARSVYGGPVPLSADRAHWADGVRVNGQASAMSPYLYYGRRVGWSALDQAALYDLGWAVPAPAGLSVRFTSRRPPVLVSAAGTGTVQVYGYDSSGNLTFSGLSFTPFGASYRGVIRAVSADINGDGWADYVFASGPGVGARLRIIDGASGADLLPITSVLGGFGGGIFVAAGDIDGDGRAEVAISADAGGDPVVAVARVLNGQLQFISYTLALNSQARVGVRVAMGDVDGDGHADVIATAGAGWSPVVRIYDGAGLAGGQIRLQQPAFFAFDPTWREGVNVTVGDLDGDGRAEIMTSLDSGGLSLVRVWNSAPAAASVSLRMQFFANGLADRNGIRLLARDIDGSGRVSLVTAPASGSFAWLRVLRLSAGSVAALPAVFPPGILSALSGIYVG
ncbi:MAG: FG-GAP-like repeat-containing protein, partial [Gemmataceae bacterium]|nr:FG-GAP-like repeat-containing protein [Gemmataceae bacterium]